MAKFHMKPLKEIYYEAMKECDDDSPGMALELGLNFFADGNPVLSDLIRQLLISAYTRSNRDLFAEIIGMVSKIIFKLITVVCVYKDNTDEKKQNMFFYFSMKNKKRCSYFV